MCGCFFWKKKKNKKVKEELELSNFPEEESIDGDITPGSSSIIIAKNNKLSDTIKDKFEAKSMLWGIPTKDKKLIINARSESVLKKPLFYDGIRKNRCVVPAISFYEWNKDKIKVTFSKKDNEIIYLAGFYLENANKSHFVILTTQANDSVVKTHHRMPLFFEANQVKNWLLGNTPEKFLSLQMPELLSYQSFTQLTLWN